jgi:hypothetical protein
MTYKTIRRAATTAVFFSTMMPAFAKLGTPATATGQAQTVAQDASTKSGGTKAASKNATAQSNASTNPQTVNPENNSPNTESNNPGIAPAGWVPQTQNQQMRAGGNRTTIPNQKGAKAASMPSSKEKKPANDGTR